MGTPEESSFKESDQILWQDLYMKGDDLQKLSVIQSLPNLLQVDHNGTITRIIPKIQQELPINSSTEFQLVTSKMFKILIEMKLDLNLMRPVFQGIENKDPIVAGAWNETLLDVIHSLSDSVVKAEVLPFAVKMSQLNNKIFYRINSCKIIGKIAVHPKITAFDVKKDVVPLTQSLCQDCLYEVRAAMCEELPNVAKGLANDINVKSCLLPCLVELSSDENMQVRAAAVDAAVLLIPCISPDTIKVTAIPLLKRLCLQCGKEGDQTFPTIAKIYGKLLNNLQVHLSEADSVWFLDHYKELSRRGLSMQNEDLETDPAMALTCREHCALNLPAVTFFAFTQIPAEMPKWYSIFKDLAGDPCYIVRKTVAGCIHEITKILGKDGKMILPDFLKLIRDDAEEVLDVLVPNIGATLALLSGSGFLSRDQTTQSTLDIGRALLKCETEIFRYYNWRRRKLFLEQLESLPTCMPADFIHQHFTPLIMKLTVEARARPVRTQAARTLLMFLRYNVKENHRKWIRESLINQLCNSNCCYTRHIFINMCADAIQIFSWKYFKEHFFLPLLTLGDDPVSTVRLCVINMCPTLKQMLIMPIDRNLQMKLENLVSKMEIMEQDKDVLNTLKSKLKEMRAPQVNKQDALLEEKRKIDEEDRILQGKAMPTSLGSRPGTGGSASVLGRGPPMTRDPTRRVPSQASNISQRGSTTGVSSASTGSTTSINEMSFLDQHFYIDAGVVLPETAATASLTGLEEDISLLTIDNVGPSKEIISTLSVENTNIENMSDEDLIELKTSTTNITDDVKMNIEKKSNASKLKAIGEGVTKRNKRSSCFFVSDTAHTDFKNHFKRRSLNLNSSEISRIPVSTKNFPDKNRKMKTGSETKPKTSFESSNVQQPSVKTDISDENKVKDNNENLYKNPNKNGNKDVKENVPINNSKVQKVKNNKDMNVAKQSNLPVLVRRGSLQNK